MIKFIISSGLNFNQYRLYTIARAHFRFRSGVFSLDELCDLLFSDYAYTSLHHEAGNNRKQFKKRLVKDLSSSPLFMLLDDGRYRIKSEKFILSRHTKDKKSGWYEISDISILYLLRSYNFGNYLKTKQEDYLYQKQNLHHLG